jgi:dipeptidyl-peptidase 4
MRDQERVFNAYLRRHELVSGGSAPPNWTPDGTGFWFVEGAPEDTQIYRVDLTSGQTESMFDAPTIRAALTAAMGYSPPYRGLPFDSFTFIEGGRVVFNYHGIQWQLDVSSNALERIGDANSWSKLLGSQSAGGQAPRMWKRSEYLIGKIDVPEQLSPSGEWFAGIRNDNIVLRSALEGEEQRALTDDGTVDRSWDIESLRFRVLPGLRMSFRAINPWSPDSLVLLAYRRDVTGVFRQPRINWLKRFEDVTFAPYQKVGARLDRIEPIFVDVRSGRRTVVAMGNIEDRYIQLLSWHPNGAEALIVVYTRDFKRVHIVAADRETGATRTLLTESCATFVKIWHNSIFSGEHGFRLLPNGNGFVWLSTRDGWNHLYHYDMSGQLISQLTSGDWPIYDIEHMGSDGFVYFTAALDVARPYDVHVCRVPLSGGGVEQLTHERGIHTPAFSLRGQAFIDTHSAVDRPVRTDLLKSDGTLIRVLSNMDIGRLEAVGYTPAEEFTVQAADGVTVLWGVMYKPFNFDPSRTYPVIEYIYGSPQTVDARRFFAVDQSRYQNMPWALAHLGYIVVCLDARGTPGRSKAFQDVAYGDWQGGFADHPAAIRQLCKRHPWMDGGRVGIIGHSWGGYFATCALIHAPQTYHAAVAYEPGYDQWEFMLYEAFLDLPRRNLAAYQNADLTKHVSKIRGRLMVIVGTADYTVFGPTMKMVRALVEARIDYELVLVPEARHFFEGIEEEYLLMKLTHWFDRHVKERASTR